MLENRRSIRDEGVVTLREFYRVQRELDDLKIKVEGDL